MRTSWIEICFDMMADYIEDFQSLADKHKFIEISTHCLSLSEHVENSFSKSCEWVSFYTFLAEGFRSVGMYEKSLEIVEKSINLINEFSEEVEISVRVWAYFIYAVITSNTEDYDTVRLYAEKVVSLYKLHDFKENKDYDLLCNTYRLLSYAARSECEFEESLLFLQSASDLSEKVSSDFRINIVHIDVERALIYLDDESHDKATQIVENACEHLELIEMYRVNMSSFPLLLSDIGYIYGQINKWNKALEFHLRCYEIEKNFFDVDSSQLSSTFHNIGYSYDGLEMYDMAIEYYEKALIHRGSLNDISTASTHECLALALQGKGSYKEAMEYFQKLEIFFEKTDEINEIIYLEIAELCDLMDNKEKAKEYREKAQRIIDSISEED